ncbi:hypothetical protein N5C66_05920 [Rhizobium pusense]|uniref:hypothetical protein n=1 Tax=Agrobacterium pusense TaxID=648995 RepID=UPI0024496904|nr:hypothetical protein [Agrobacterium pusense]MDH1097434.1 hypothetical protein [Agrobacterium pusense]MDH1111264.1 hypothetical protein [Agrobacterium pusense]MDH2193467.1 hypothetical protein [Agrobacterium pusense]
MPRTFDADHILSVLIEAYQQQEHFILRKEGRIFARLVTDDEGGAAGEVCLTDIAILAAERLSK